MIKILVAFTLISLVFVTVFAYRSRTTKQERISREDGEQVVFAIASNLTGEIGGPPANPPETKELSLFEDVYTLDLEIGSGASFDQYFVWASPEQIQRIVSQLEYLELHEHARITQAAIDVAFPKGAPKSYSEKESEFDIVESREDHRGPKLKTLYWEFSNIGHLSEPLYEFVIAKDIMEMKRFRGMFK